MSGRSFEELAAEFQTARREESRARAIAFAGLTHSLCGVEVVAYQPRHRLCLGLVRNALLGGVEPMAGDIFQFLWFLSPRFCEKPGFRGRLERWLIMRKARSMNLRAAEIEISKYIREQLRDNPGEFFTEAEGPDYSGHVHWAAFESSFWIRTHGGFTIETWLSTPYLVLQQLFRAYQTANPGIIVTKTGAVSDPPIFRNASDRIYADLLRTRRAELAAIFLEPRQRMN